MNILEIKTNLEDIANAMDKEVERHTWEFHHATEWQIAAYEAGIGLFSMAVGAAATVSLRILEGTESSSTSNSLPEQR